MILLKIMRVIYHKLGGGVAFPQPSERRSTAGDNFDDIYKYIYVKIYQFYIYINEYSHNYRQPLELRIKKKRFKENRKRGPGGG